MESKTKTKKPFLSVDLIEELEVQRKKQLTVLDRQLKSFTKKEVLVEQPARLDGISLERLLNRYPTATTLVESIKQERERLVTRMGQGGAFVEDEIKAVAHAYALRFVTAHRYKGKYPSDIAQNIKSTIERCGLGGKNVDAYVLAPAKDLNLQVDPEPVLFLTANDGIYYAVRKWGRDFTIFRRLVSPDFYVTRTIFWSIFALAVLGAGLIYPAMSWNSSWHWMGKVVVVLTQVVSALTAIVTIIFLILEHTGTGSRERNYYYNKDLWNSNNKRENGVN
jgi:hypothetical protein